MKTAKPISVILAATVSAVLYGATATIFVPCLAFLYLLTGANPPMETSSELGMTFALAAPLVFATLGFACGLVMAFMFNLFVNTERRREAVRQERLRVRAAALTDAA